MRDIFGTVARLGGHLMFAIQSMTLCALLAALSLAACATQPQQQWYRAGATQQDFAMDQGQCQAQGLGVSGASVLQVALVYNACMRGKGWELH